MVQGINTPDPAYIRAAIVTVPVRELPLIAVSYPLPDSVFAPKVGATHLETPIHSSQAVVQKNRSAAYRLDIHV